jgi:chemotaxis protein MotB
MTYFSLRQKKADKHIDDWLMTYADMITLLLCFFVLFLSAAFLNKKVHKDAVPITVEQVKSPAPQILRPLVAQFDLPFPDQPEDPVIEEKPLPVADAAPIVSEPVVLQAPPADPVLQSSQVDKGDRITIVELPSSAFFESGSSLLTSTGKEVLEGVASELKDGRYDGYRITVEGHTDDNPIHTTQFPSNWELSTSRAASVVRYLLDQGLPSQRLCAVGFADSQPKAPNRDESGMPLPKNQTQNRRVAIRLEKIDKS